MKLIDTVVIIGFLNTKDRLYVRSSEHMERISKEDDIFVPVSSLIEADLIMKISGYTDSEREFSWGALETEISNDKVISNSSSSFRHAADYQKNGADYFDSLIASLAKETNSIVITTDKRIGEIVGTEW
jgi:predicted nucleic-acid-binding protein